MSSLCMLYLCFTSAIILLVYLIDREVLFNACKYMLFLKKLYEIWILVN